MCEMYIERKLDDSNIKKIKLTKEEIKKAWSIYTEKLENETLAYYKKELTKMLIEEYSKKFLDYFIKNESSFFNELADACLENQDSIDNIGIYFVFDLVKNSKNKLEEIYKEYKKKEVK